MNKTSSQSQNNEKTVLPAEKTQAMQHLIKVTQSLIEMAEKEAQALAQNDMLAFAILQDEKTLLAEHYAKASEEFRARLPEFRNLNNALLDRLERMQNRLGAISRENNDIVQRIYKSAEKSTKQTLLDAQEIGQNKVVHFMNGKKQKQEGEQNNA